MPEPSDKLWWYRSADAPAPLIPRDRWWSPRREHRLDALACLALSALCFSQARSETLFLTGWDFYSRVPLGALCTGGYALAKAGLLDKYRATIHWENLSALREEFPRIRLSDQLFTIDHDRFTCSGGVAPLDLMLHLVESKLGAQVSQLISEQFIVERVRNDRDRQYVPLRAQIGVSHESLIKVAQLMEENIERPLSLDEIASATGLSRRQIERLFKRHLNCVPKRYYLQLRLRRARELLLQTSMPIIDITTACGFQSPPHFSRCYRAQFGCPPSSERLARQPKLAGQVQPPVGQLP